MSTFRRFLMMARETIRSCFGSGRWFGYKPWIGTDKWKGTP